MAPNADTVFGMKSGVIGAVAPGLLAGPSPAIYASIFWIGAATRRINKVLSCVG